MDDDLQVVDDVIEDDEDLTYETCQLEETVQQMEESIDGEPIPANAEEEEDDVYFEQSNADNHEEEMEHEDGETNKTRSEKWNDSKRSEDGKKQTTPGKFKEDFDDEGYDTPVEEGEAGVDQALTDDAEGYEKDFLNLPPLHSVMNVLGTLKQGRRVTAQPIKMEDLSHPVMQEIFSKLSSEDVKLQFVRSKDNPEEWRGFLLMHFSSCQAAKEASEQLKVIRDDLEVKSQNETAFANKTLEQWIKNEKGEKKWTDSLVLVRNIPDGIEVEEIREVFPDSGDILLQKMKDKTKEAYIMCNDKEHAERVAEEARASEPVLGGSKLRVFKYHMPQENNVKGLLRLSQRKTLLKYVDRLQSELDKEETVDDYKAPVWCKKRLEAGKQVLERDDKARQRVGLVAPSYQELVDMNVKSIRSNSRKEALLRMGVIERLPRKQNYYGNSSSSGGGNRRGGSYSQNRQKSNYDSRSFQSMGSNNRRSESLLGNPPSLTAMSQIVPPLLALQHNAALMRSSDWMMMNHRQQHRGLEGSVSSMRQGGGGREPPAKLLRMDEKGMYHNFRSQGGRGGGANRGRGDKRPISLLDLCWSTQGAHDHRREDGYRGGI